MPTSRSRISPSVLRDLARKVHGDDPAQAGQCSPHPALTSYQKWAVILIGGAWFVLLAAAPLVLVLLPFGRNDTVHWLIAGAWLLGITFIAVSLYLIAAWLDQSLHNGQPNINSLITGMALLTSTIGVLLLIWQEITDQVSPQVTVGVTVLLGVIFIGWGVYQLMSDRKTLLIFRLSFLIGMLCFGISLTLSVLSLHYEAFGIAPGIVQTIQAIGRLLSPIGWGTLLVSNLGRGETTTFRWSKRTIVLVLVMIGAILILALIRMIG
jgi:hypothetical protein